MELVLSTGCKAQSAGEVRLCNSCGRSLPPSPVRQSTKPVKCSSCRRGKRKPGARVGQYSQMPTEERRKQNARITEIRRRKRASDPEYRSRLNEAKRRRRREKAAVDGRRMNSRNGQCSSRVNWELNARQAWRWWLSVKAPAHWRRAYVAARHRHRYHTEPRYALRHRVKRWMQKHLKENANPESRKWATVLGYTPDELRVHLERQFVGRMSWSNMGKWHIDHIVPVAAFTFESPTDLDFRRCFALTNLRPVWARANLTKGDRPEFLL